MIWIIYAMPQVMPHAIPQTHAAFYPHRSKTKINWNRHSMENRSNHTNTNYGICTLSFPSLSDLRLYTLYPLVQQRKFDSIMYQSISTVPIPPRADPQELGFFESKLANAPPPGQKSCSNAPW